MIIKDMTITFGDELKMNDYDAARQIQNKFAII